ncbi:hypothetical protein GCM10011519_05830 [Marmoricola endophyticus]|uniref:Cobyrinic acid a,c-diamide synthase n=1 Tax=Marmoricola endophyticus TaxID=2040280 RepID=A0A917BCK6_9ACTN|nr:hypothetical protein [Marmoricola endophyticus]GGF35220.1 hypothetical protein GCM10011519_05830 [Marmoricola endophyticus]
MARRVSMPTADDLFRPTAPEQPAPAAADAVPEPAEQGPRQPSGRVRHDEKMTVYVTSEELLAIEQARLVLRGTHALAVDRGRLVREAVGMALADLEENGERSRLVRRLRGE